MMLVVELGSILIIALSLSLDSFAVSVASGLNVKRVFIKDALILAAIFAIVQALAPLIGWLLGSNLPEFISNYGNVIAFLILAYIGSKMIISARQKRAKKAIKHLKITTIVILAIATSIDAFAVGVGFNLLSMPIMLLMIITAFVTFILSYFGYIFGTKLGYTFTHNANALGGIALVLIGVKILIFG